MGIVTGTFGSDNIRGTTGLDVILGMGGHDVIWGLDGIDVIDGGNGDDVIYANTDERWSDSDLDVITAGAGNDFVYAGLGDAANGGTGFDVLSLDLSTSAVGIDADFRPMTLLDLGGLLTLDLGGAQLAGFEAIGTLIGSAQDDNVTLGNRAHHDALVMAGAGDDMMRTGNGNDTLRGESGNDLLVGGSGKDTLDGGADADRLLGGRGADQLTGGSGADTFIFEEGDTSAGRKNADTITDFSQAEGDRISLVRLDAVVDNGRDLDDRFHFVGANAFSGAAGELRAVSFDGDTFVSGDTNGDGAADFSIQLHGEIMLTAADFVL